MNSNNTDDIKKTNESPEISSDLIRGHINTIILRTLYENDKYGYEIINEIEEKSKGQYSLKQPTLYSALKRLETQDYVTSYWGGASGGGRRKYFQITDKGKAIVEQNLAEWEYSRTVIDSLISNRDFDFNNPPPAASVDFNILKQSTTRVPVTHSEEGDKEEKAEPAAQDAQSEQTDAKAETVQQSAESEAVATQSVPTEEPVQKEPEKPLTEEEKRRIHDNYKALIGNEETATSNFYAQSAGKKENNDSPAEPAQPPVNAPYEPQYQQAYEPQYQQQVYGQQQYQQPYEPQYQQQYGQPYQQQPYEPQYQQPYTPQPQYTNEPQQTYAAAPEENRSIASELLYSNKPPAERNYKSLLNKLYDNTQHPEEEMQPIMQQAEEEPFTEPTEPIDANATQQPFERATVQGASTASNIEFYDVEEKAQKEGLRVTTTNGTRNRSAAKSVGNTFNKGKALLITAVYIFFIALAECIVNHALQNQFLSGRAYIVVPYVLNFAMLGVFLFMYLGGYGKKARKTKSSSYISASFIIFTNILLIIALIAYFIISAAESTELSIAMQIVKYAVFPVVYAFNLPLFALIYKLNCNRQ